MYVAVEGGYSWVLFFSAHKWTNSGVGLHTSTVCTGCIEVKVTGDDSMLNIRELDRFTCSLWSAMTKYF